MKNFDRYGSVEIDDEGRITSFNEKKYHEEGLINAGVYFLNVKKFMDEDLPEKFSFEKDYLEKNTNTHLFYGIANESYFIDIGIPEDYEKAKRELSAAPYDKNQIDDTWSLFLDRDGVINRELKDEYVTNWDSFEFYPGVTEAIKKLSKVFGHVFIVTNQRGVSKGLMSEDDLLKIHQFMNSEIEKKGGHIDAIYYCTSLDDKHPERKCNPGLAFRAKADFPEVDLNRSIMVGNKMSDMKFGRNAGMYTAFIASTNPDIPFPHPDIDMRFDALADFAKGL